MKSVLNIQAGKPERHPKGVRLPLAIDISSDDSDDEDMPEIEYIVMSVIISDKALNLGREEVAKAAIAELDTLRGNFTVFGYEKIEKAIAALLEKTDITKMAKPYIPEPENRYIH